MTVLRWLLVIPSNLVIAFMIAYRRLISPLYGQVCRYYPSCSRYALEAYQYRGFFQATRLTVWRLLRCNPWSSGGVDDVPRATNETYTVTKHGFRRPRNRKEIH